jgi:type II secretory pathway component GspD/PulD (secretin)
MKKVIWNTLTAMCAAGLISSARAQDTAPASPPDNQNPPVGADNTAAGDQPAEPAATTAAPDDTAPATTADTAPATADDNATMPARPARPAGPEDRPAAALSLAARSADTFTPPTAAGTNLDELSMNFVKAPLVEVLNYLSDAAGFTIIMDPGVQVRGTVSMISAHTVNRDMAVALLNQQLNSSGLAAIRNDQMLRIVDKGGAKFMDIPVKTANEVTNIPNNAEIATWIIPVRYVDAGQLTRDLASFVSQDATIVANDMGNTIVITDTQSNIRHLMEIIKAVDDSAEGETQIKVYHMKYANPSEVANDLASIFPSSGQGGTQPVRVAGGGGAGGFLAAMMGGAGGGRRGGGGAAASGGSSRIQKQTTVLAVPDLRTESVVVTASSDMIPEIDKMMTELDIPSGRDQKVYVRQLKSGDPMADLTMLQNLFGGNNRTTTSQSSALQTRETQAAAQGGAGTSSSGSSMGGSRTGTAF